MRPPAASVGPSLNRVRMHRLARLPASSRRGCSRQAAGCGRAMQRRMRPMKRWLRLHLLCRSARLCGCVAPCRQTHRGSASWCPGGRPSRLRCRRRRRPVMLARARWSLACQLGARLRRAGLVRRARSGRPPRSRWSRSPRSTRARQSRRRAPPPRRCCAWRASQGRRRPYTPARLGKSCSSPRSAPAEGHGGAALRICAGTDGPLGHGRAHATGRALRLLYGTAGGDAACGGEARPSGQGLEPHARIVPSQRGVGMCRRTQDARHGWDASDWRERLGALIPLVRQKRLARGAATHGGNGSALSLHM
mmetsp:Transcript_10238/g.33762  ORF Transcript_10238/g.33762 Transcript_10238/m.33762 type:complete len:307 (+) Transcript_10238:1018-1938(+)